MRRAKHAGLGRCRWARDGLPERRSGGVCLSKGDARVQQAMKRVPGLISRCGGHMLEGGAAGGWCWEWMEEAHGLEKDLKFEAKPSRRTAN